MSIGWSDISFAPGPAFAAEIAAAWQWLVPGEWSPFLCAMIGGIFFEDASGVYWLDTGTAFVERVAESKDEFDQIAKARDGRIDEWFLPALVERLHLAGKRPGEGESFAFVIQPIFAEATFGPENVIVASAREQLVGVAAIHRQLSEIPDGTPVPIRSTD